MWSSYSLSNEVKLSSGHEHKLWWADSPGSGSLADQLRCDPPWARTFSSMYCCSSFVMGSYSSLLPSLSVTQVKCTEKTPGPWRTQPVPAILYPRDDSFLISKPQLSDHLLWHCCFGLFKLSDSAWMWTWLSLQRFICGELGSPGWCWEVELLTVWKRWFSPTPTPRMD